MENYLIQIEDLIRLVERKRSMLQIQINTNKLPVTTYVYQLKQVQALSEISTSLATVIDTFAGKSTIAPLS